MLLRGNQLYNPELRYSCGTSVINVRPRFDKLDASTFIFVTYHNTRKRGSMQTQPFEVLFWFLVIVMFAIYACYKMITEDDLGGATRTRRPSNQTRPRRRSPTSDEPFSTPRVPPTTMDPASSPIGKTCLKCGIVFEEEIEEFCPGCGIKRERCPICHRFVADGQELLACPYCKTLGHANEIIDWVRQKQKCPYCAQELDTSTLVDPDTLAQN
ncbi:MAG: hypothetical protein ACFFD8_07590 [Candidatus Thorarchaeota archaeon]